jgi:integrase
MSAVERRRSERPTPDGRRGWCPARFAPHQLRHAHAIEMAHEGVPLVVIPRQLGQHSNLGITSVYLQGIDNAGHRHRPHPPRTDDPGQHVVRL